VFTSVDIEVDAVESHDPPSSHRMKNEVLGESPNFEHDLAIRGWRGCRHIRRFRTRHGVS
jgi:hypothetical protein